MTNREFFIQTWQNEMKITAGAIKALPHDMGKLDYKPSAKSRSAAEIISHILPHAEAMNNATKTFVLNEGNKDFKSVEEASDYFEKNAALLVESLKNTDDKTWEEKIIPFEFEGHRLFEYPMQNMFWIFLFDTVHHRGQLSTYYRPMGVINPHIYGPTAEDAEKMVAENN